jgi:hypothetical protein
MHRTISKGTLLGVSVLALVAAFALLLGSFSSTDKAEAASGSLTGTYDILVDIGVPIGTTGTGLYHCIGHLEHTVVGGADDTLSTAFVCYADAELGDPNGEPPGAENEGNDGMEGPPPPPPYTTLEPQLGSGTLDDDVAGGGPTGTATSTTCFNDIGGISAPNIIASVVNPLAKTDIGDGNMVGTVVITANQSNESCANSSPVTGAAIPVILYRVADKAGAAATGATGGCEESWRANVGASCTDYDGDGCTDATEVRNATSGGTTLASRPHTATSACGDDPYNPYDSSVASLVGNFSTLATVTRVDCPGPEKEQCDWGGGPDDPAAGAYYHCLSVQSGADPSYDTRIYCYIDIPGVEVNPEGFAGCEGDGLPGASPPGVIDSDQDASAAVDCFGLVVVGDMDAKHTELTSTKSGAGTATVLNTTGCFEDQDAQSALGHVYVDAQTNAYTGIGDVQIYVAQTLANCNAGTPTGAPAGAKLQAARQSTSLSTSPAAEVACANALDDDGDGRVNDGCPVAGGAPEIGIDDGDAMSGDEPCTDAVNSDGGDDALVNDGCPPYGNSASYRDSDGDGCSDVEELSDSGAVGGLRDPYNRGDWADVDGNGTIDLFVDIFGIAGVFGGAAPGPPYDVAFDVGGPAVTGGQLWTQIPPDGTIDLFNDIFGAAFQFGHSC